MRTNFYQKILKRKYPYIIADIGANHNGDMELAKKMIDELVQVKCNAAKFQSWNKNSLFTKGFYKEKSQFVDEKFGTLEQMVEKFSISKDDHITLKKYCDWKKITFCSSSFSFEEVDMLDALGVFEEYSVNSPEKILEFSDWMRIELEPYKITLDRFKNLLLKCASKSET